MLNVLQVHNKYKFEGGEDTVVANELKLLRDAGINVSTLYFTNEDVGAAAIIYNKTSAKRLTQAIKTFKPHIIHLHNLFYKASPSILIIAKKHNIPVVMTLHNYRLICPNAMFLREGKTCLLCKNKTFAHPAIVHKCFKNSYMKTALMASSLYTHNILGTWRDKVDRFIVLTPFAKKMFANSALELDDSNLVVKPNSTDDISVTKTNIRSGYVFVGRLSEEKGVHTLVEAFNKMPEVSLDIMGTGELESDLKSIAHSNITFLGNVSHKKLKSKISSYKALIFSSIVFEGLPNSIIESFAAGTPVIASDIDNINDIVTHNYNGLLFKVGNPESLKETIRSFNANTREEYYDNAKMTFIKNYTHKVNLDALLLIYQDLLKNT